MIYFENDVLNFEEFKNSGHLFATGQKINLT